MLYLSPYLYSKLSLRYSHSLTFCDRTLFCFTIIGPFIAPLLEMKLTSPWRPLLVHLFKLIYCTRPQETTVKWRLSIRPCSFSRGAAELVHIGCYFVHIWKFRSAVHQGNSIRWLEMPQVYHMDLEDPQEDACCRTSIHRRTGKMLQIVDFHWY